MTDIALTVEDATATLLLDRPERLNALTTSMLSELVDTLEQVHDTPGIRVLEVRGAGRGFCAGGDLADIAAEEALGAVARTGVLRRHMRAAELLRHAPFATVAVVQGACAGAGFALAAACDVRVAAVDAVFRAAFLGAGVSGDFGLAWSLVHLVGESRAREILLLDEKISGARAAEMGLVARAVPADELEAAAAEVVARLASAPPLAVAALKQNVAEAADASFAEALGREASRHVATGRSADALEAGRAFLERRTPVFEGR